jgi:disulfide bond formation protein DsbB
MPEPVPPIPGNGRTLAWVWLALLIALAAVVGSLWYSLGMNYRACPLCFYQRTFAMSVVGVLLMGQVAGVRDGRVLAVIVLPLTVAGLGVAGFHAYLETSGKLECPPAMLGLWSIPGQSTVAFAAMSLALLLGLITGPGERSVGAFLTLAALVLGAAFALASIKSAPKPATPSKPYDAVKEPLDVCRPPYVPPAGTPDVPAPAADPPAADQHTPDPAA